MAEARHALLVRGRSFAVVSLYLNEQGGMVGSLNPFQPEPYFRVMHPDILEAIDAYTKAVKDSLRVGWQIAFTGRPNFG